MNASEKAVSEKDNSGVNVKKIAVQKDTELRKTEPLEDETIDPFILDKIFANPGEVLTVLPAVKDLAKDCLFVFDTNVLLSPFSIGKTSLNEIDRILTKLAGEKRLFVPEHALREFAQRRSDKIAEIFKTLDHNLSNLPSLKPLEIPLLEHEAAYISANQAVEAMRTASKEYKKQVELLVKSIKKWCVNDPVSTLYAKVFTADTIRKHDQSEAELKKDCDSRREHKRPPGYKDYSKPNNYMGDLLIWHTILHLGKETSKDVVFVSDDEKRDWRVSHNKKALFPRYELIAEFYSATKRHFTILSFPDFLELLEAGEVAVEAAEAVSSSSTSEGMQSFTTEHLYLLQRVELFAELAIKGDRTLEGIFEDAMAIYMQFSRFMYSPDGAPRSSLLASKLHPFMESLYEIRNEFIDLPIDWHEIKGLTLVEGLTQGGDKERFVVSLFTRLDHLLHQVRKCEISKFY